MNLIPKIAEMLGVELGEEFKINPLSGVYKLYQDGLLNKRDDGKWYNTTCLTPLLTGQYKIEKLPFDPKEGDTYYFVSWSINRCCQQIYAIKSTFCLTSGCALNKYSGNCFRTEAEAEAHKYEVYKKLTGEEWGK